MVQELYGYCAGWTPSAGAMTPTTPTRGSTPPMRRDGRIKEFREMVQAIKQNISMNVVMDVVYNHTNEAGSVQIRARQDCALVLPAPQSGDRFGGELHLLLQHGAGTRHVRQADG